MLPGCVWESLARGCVGRGSWGGMCVLNVLGRGLLIQEWEGVCCRVWSAGVRTEKEPREEEEEGFYGVPGTPIAPRKVASCRGVRAPVWEGSNSLLWLLASNPTPG